MANTIAIDSKEGPRTKPNGSRTLLCAFHPRFWGETPDDICFLQSSSGNMGRDPGRAIHLGSVLDEKRPRCFLARNPTGTSQSILRYAVQQAQAKVGEPLGFARRPWLESLAGVFASDGATITNERSAGVFADRGLLRNVRFHVILKRLPRFARNDVKG